MKNYLITFFSENETFNFQMLNRLYDQNGKRLDHEKIKIKNQERWKHIFSSLALYNDTEYDCHFTTIEDYIKRKRKINVKQRHSEQICKSDQEKENKIIPFLIPDFVIEATVDENETQTNTDNSSQTPISSEIQSENKLNVVDKGPQEKNADKKVYKLQIGVADFAKKVKDNEGMGISTFSNEQEMEDGENEENENSLNRKRKIMKSSLSTLRTDHYVKMLAIATTKRKEFLLKQRTPIEKFLHGIRIAMLLMKTCRTSSQQTERNNKKFLTFADYQVAEVDKKSNGMFDISKFKAQKESILSTDAIEIMRINPKQRSIEMVHSARLAINATVEAFSEFPLNMQTSLIERGWYEKFEAKRIIIRQGHSALNFYFIISGITTVSVARTNKATGETYSETVAFLKKGNSFGELALMFGGKRSATVSCKTDVELLAVSREDFIDIFMSTSSNEEPDHIRLLRGLPLLSQWPIDELPYDDPSICLFTYFRRGTVLCHDSNSGSWVYIVKSGTCRIIKFIQLNSQEQKEKLKHQRDSNDYFTFLTQSFTHSTKSHSKHEIPPPEIRPSKEFNGKYYIQLKILSVGSVFGLEPMAFEFVGGTTGVTLVSDGAELVAIERNFFQKHMSRQYQSWLRKELQPFPTIENLKGKLKNFYQWADYKESMIRAIIFDKLNY